MTANHTTPVLMSLAAAVLLLLACGFVLAVLQSAIGA